MEVWQGPKHSQVAWFYFSQVQEPQGAIQPWEPPAAFLELEGQQPQEKGWRSSSTSYLSESPQESLQTKSPLHRASPHGREHLPDVGSSQASNPKYPASWAQVSKANCRSIAQWGKRKSKGMCPRAPKTQLCTTLPELGGPSQDWETKWVSLRLNALANTQAGHWPPPPAGQGQLLHLLSHRWGGEALLPPTSIRNVRLPLPPPPDSLPPHILYSTKPTSAHRGFIAMTQCCIQTPPCPGFLPVSLVTSETKYPVTAQPVFTRSLCLAGTALTAMPLTLCMHIPLVTCAPRAR